MKEMEVLKENLELTGAIHSTKISGHFGPKLNGSVRFWLNGSRPTKPIDLIHVIRHLCKRFRIDGSKAMSGGISGGKQVTKFANTSYRARVCLFSPNETTI